MTIKRTDGKDPDFESLVRQSNAFYRSRFGDAMDYYDQFNTIEDIAHAVVIYNQETPVACGCLRQHDDSAVEIKRMYVIREWRKQGFATAILSALEVWAKELGYESSVLETSASLIEAVTLYRKHGYRPIDNYGPYVGVETSVCMKKDF